MQHLHWWRGACLGVVFASLYGCSSSDTKPAPDVGDTVAVSGIVEIDGKPLAGAVVYFRAESERQFNGAYGATDSAGKYELKTDIGGGKTKPGVPPGPYVVTVSKFVKPDGTSPPPGMNDPNQMIGARESIPMAYSDRSSSRLKYDVPASGGTFDIKMSSTP